ncbi:zinc finger SWIM domain-containing protein 7 isoform X1 [Strix uralensis]|uniref:zinc finger SWIM domain-containing protein 7 isoform X1 n=1 Tax=Strix uralensis TaxID=36305 RepID=UPI003DA6D5BD
MRARASPGAKGACCYGDAPSWLRCHSHEASANGMDSTLPAVAEELLKEIKKAFQETSHVPDDLLLGLKFIFGPCAVPALDLVDHRSVTRVTSPSGRTAYQVLGSSGKLYTCYSSCHFCTCPAFGFTVLQKSESLLVSSHFYCYLLELDTSQDTQAGIAKHSWSRAGRAASLQPAQPLLCSSLAPDGQELSHVLHVPGISPPAPAESPWRSPKQRHCCP